MKNCAVIFGICSLSLAGLSLGSTPNVVGRTIYHADDSRTESVSDPSIREMTEMTYNPAGQLTVKKVFLLNEKGDPLQGNVYDGRGNLVARCQMIYDELGRRKEDRLTNLNGEVFQQVIHEYGKDGKALTPKLINLKTATQPVIAPAPIDFTGQQPAPGANAPNSSRFAPQQLPAGGQPAAGPVVPPQLMPPPEAPKEEAKPKPNFFKKLFKK
ncbi:hypothetical protein WJU23_03355 [Prosthecobacter sp. SYSU 5D2]|uniref:hypothetical protein n=1 Tax=Prosthecobacter sp. SYSU 5D2 TaxID=3134134 RepID=UPI0031FF071E